MAPVPPPPPGFTRHPNPRFRRGSGRRYVPDVVEQVRVLVEGTELTYAGIAARTGIGITTIQRWRQKRGWVRPAGAAGWVPLVAVERAGLGHRMQADLVQLAQLAERLPEADREAGAALAAEARRLAAMHGRPGRPVPRPRPPEWGGLVRLSAAPPPQGFIRDADRVEAARRLIEGTTLKLPAIAARLGLSRATVSIWTQNHGWRRPAGAASPFGGHRPGRRGRLVVEARQLARDRLLVAERRLDALALSEAATCAELQTVLDAIVEARNTLARRKRARRAGEAASWPAETILRYPYGSRLPPA